MERAELGADHQDNGVGICLAEGLGGTQCRKSRVTAHEAKVVALHGRIQAEGADDLVVRSGVEEPGAGDRHEMGDVRRFDSGAGIQRGLGGLHEQLGGFAAEDVVADLGAGAQHQAGVRVKELRIVRSAVLGEFRDSRVPGVDGGGIKARAHQPGTQPGKARLGGKYIAGFRLNEYGGRDSSFQGPHVDRHGSFSASFAVKTMAGELL